MTDEAGKIVERLRGRRFGVVCVGNDFRGDDGAGPALAALLAGRKIAAPVVDATEVPENYGGWPAKEGLESVLFVDAVEMGAEPGVFQIIPLGKLMVSASSTHRLSLHFTIRFLENDWDGDAFLVGVQPKSIELDAGLSDEVRAGVEALADAIERAAGAP